jgi:predicted nuclease of restriction endonuclease-like (RecB) superfamily
MTDVAQNLPSDYAAVLGRLKAQVRTAQSRAQRVVNTELIVLYWTIGAELLQQQKSPSWGSDVVGRLADDLRAEFPSMKGFSRSNLAYMRSFARDWPDRDAILQQPAGKLPWTHITSLIDKVDDQATRERYAAAAVENGWSRNALTNHIANKTLERTGAAQNNFAEQLAPLDSDLARQLAKDPYVFDFLDLTKEAAERDFEQALTDNIVETLRELGPGFAFVGRQVHFDIDGDDFYIDLLFFHVEQMRYIVVELKTGKFKPEYTGQLGFYVAIVDDVMKREQHAPTIGILICGSRSERTVRYSLGKTTSPLAVASYTFDSLPANERAVLPVAEKIAAALDWTLSDDAGSTAP